MTMALEGIRVLDFTQMMMGPWATQFLGDMGADVIKVERPGVGEWERGLRSTGDLIDGQSPFFLAMNRNKKSLTLNLKDPRARDVVLKLAGSCDLVVENFRPGVMDRLGLGYQDLSAVRPSIVYVSGSGFGQSGPYVDRSRAGMGGAWLSAPFGIYRTADGHLALAMASLTVVGELLEEPRLAEYDDPRRAYDDRDAVFQLVQARLVERSTAEWIDLLATKDVWCAPVQDFADVGDDPQVAHNELLTTVKHPNGDDLRVVGFPMRFSATPGSIRSGPPAGGQQTDEVLSSLGFEEDEIRELRDEGVV